jgi:hypothetical protein
MLGDSAESVGNVSKQRVLFCELISLVTGKSVIVVGQAYPHPYNTLETFTGLKRLQALSIRAGPALWGLLFVDAGLLLSFCRRRRWLFEP